jgi:CheY-like chemotaxis protein
MGEQVLVVEDNPVNARLMSFVLSRKGYDVRVAENAQQALVQIARARPRAILMDLQLPGMDGLELTRRLKAEPATSDIVIIAVTAYAMKGDEERALAAGCDGYVSKPIEKTVLFDLLAKGLAARTPKQGG